MSTIKYRAACDHCSATKIKCTQERPQCARCRALGRACHYSRSLRAGKPARSSQGLNRKLQNPPVLPRNTTPPDAATGAINADKAWTNAATPYPTPPATAPSNSADVFQFPDLQHTDARSSSNASIMGADWFFDFNSGAGLTSELPNSNTLAKFESSPEPPHTKSRLQIPRLHTPQMMDLGPFEEVIGMPPKTTIGSPITSSNDRCIRLAIETLNSLYQMPTTAVDNSGSNHPSVDEVLTSSAKAVQAAQELVTCQCAKDFYLPVLISIIISKIIAWYQAVAFIRDPCTELPDGKVCAKEVVVDGPLALGAYQLDDKVGWMLKNQIVLGQLQQLNDVITRYHLMFCGDGLGGHAVAEEGRLYVSMGGFMRSRLHFTMQEIESRLKASGAQ